MLLLPLLLLFLLLLPPLLVPSDLQLMLDRSEVLRCGPDVAHRAMRMTSADLEPLGKFASLLFLLKRALLLSPLPAPHVPLRGHVRPEQALLDVPRTMGATPTSRADL